MRRGDVVAPCNWVRHQLVVSSTDPADLMRRHGQRMETVPKRVSQTPRSGTGPSPGHLSQTTFGTPGTPGQLW